jgi:type III secretory pathway component EscT
LARVPSLLATVADALGRSGVDLGGLGLAWARAAPAVTIVPAFGLRALPGPARAVLGLGLAATVFPALVPLAASGHPWPLLALREMAFGLPVAVAAAVPLWAATMAGGVFDALRGGSQGTTSAPTVEQGATPLGAPLSVLACAIFLATGGPSKVALALASPAAHPDLAAASLRLAVLAAVSDLTAGVTLAVALAGPLLAASVVIEVAGALVARAASPAQLHLLLAPVRALALLFVLAFSFERMAVFLAAAVEHAPAHLAP